MGNQIESDAIQTIKGELEESKKEVLALKNAVSGYKRSNENYRDQVAMLKARVERYKFLDLEGDQLYEEKIIECDWLEHELNEARSVRCDTVPLTRFAELKQSLKSKQSFIESLQQRVHDLTVEKSELEGQITVSKGKIAEMENILIELRTPWYKKLFR